jgi:hypothetical protein
MINFDEILHDLSRVKTINFIVLWQTTNFLIVEYFNPLILTVSATGSAVYIWLKIKKEFFDNKK